MRGPYMDRRWRALRGAIRPVLAFPHYGFDKGLQLLYMHRMGRPRTSEERRRRNFPLRISALERAMITAAADALGETLSAFVRRAAIDRAARVTGANQPTEEETDDE